MAAEGRFGAALPAGCASREHAVLVGSERLALVVANGQPRVQTLSTLQPPANHVRLPSAPEPWFDGQRLYATIGPRPQPLREDEPQELHALVALELGEPPSGHARSLFRHRPGGLPLANLELGDEDRKILLSPALTFHDGMVGEADDLWMVLTVPVDTVNVHCYLACLDANDGQPRWVTFLCQGAPVSREPDWNRQEIMAFPDMPASPLALAEHLVVVGTNLGIVAAVDSLSGELVWAYRYQRVASGPKVPAGWPRAPVRVANQRCHVTPSDSGEWLELWALPRDGRLEAHPPRRKRDFESLLGIVDGCAYLLERNAAETLVARIGLADGRRYDAQPLQPGETLRGLPLLTAKSLVVVTDRTLYRFDLARDLFLEEVVEPRAGERERLLGAATPAFGGLLLATPRGFALRLPR
jgi:hypothetical protein